MTILHTNDIHGRFEEVSEDGGPLCDKIAQKTKRCYGGVARMATVVKQIKADEDNVIFLDGGDRFTGSIWTEVYRGNATKKFVNKLNYTAVTLGNHDFDYGILDLINFIQGINPSVVVSNINTSQEPLWPSDQKLIKRTKIIDVGGEKIGIVGYTVEETSRTSNPGPNIKFLPIINSIRKAVAHLELNNITKIIAVGHAGFDVDKEIAKKVKGVDIVVGGHTNTFLYTGNPPSTEKSVGPYPYIINPEYNKSLSIPVVQAFAYTKYLGHLQVTFDDQGHVTSWHGNPILLDYKVKKDVGVYQMVKRMKVLVDKQGEATIGQSKVKLDASNKICQTQPCVLGRVMADAMVYHFRSHNASIALFNGNSIRSSLPTDKEGNVLYKDIFVSFPFRNSIDLVEMYGESLLKSLEVSDFLQVAGLRVQYSFSNSSTRRIKTAEVRDPLCSTDNCYRPIDKTKLYKVVVNSYIATLGNSVIIKSSRNRIRGGWIYDVIVEYFKENSPINVDLGATTNTGLEMERSRNIFFIVTIASFLFAMF